MKIREMDEREYNRFQNLEGQADKAYKDKQKSFRTEKIYKDAMSEFCKHLAVEYKINNIENIKAKHVISFVAEMQQNGLSPTTQKNYMSAIRDFADRVGIDQRNIPSNQRLEISTRVFGNVDRTWTDKEFNDFKDAAKAYDTKQGEGPRMELILDVARKFGCRLEGILNLDINSISKALATGELLTKEKNGKINIKPVERLEQREILEKIKAYGEENKKSKIFVPNNFKETYKEVQNFVYNNRENIQDQERVKSADARIVYTESKEICKANLTLHGLRHTYLQEQREYYIKNGDSPKQADLKVSRLAGHNREEVTKIYLAKANK